jgi:uncharacterized membrane protein
MAIGWGGFNLVEGIIDHHILGLHHVREAAANPLVWDIGFLVLGAGLVAIGVWLSRRGLAGATDMRERLRRVA